MGVILWHKIMAHNEDMSKLPCVSLFQIFSAMFLPEIIWTDLQLGKLLQKQKGWTFLSRHSVVFIYFSE